MGAVEELQRLRASSPRPRVAENMTEEWLRRRLEMQLQKLATGGSVKQLGGTLNTMNEQGIPPDIVLKQLLMKQAR